MIFYNILYTNNFFLDVALNYYKKSKKFLIYFIILIN